MKAAFVLIPNTVRSSLPFFPIRLLIQQHAACLANSTSPSVPVFGKCAVCSCDWLEIVLFGHQCSALSKRCKLINSILYRLHRPAQWMEMCLFFPD